MDRNQAKEFYPILQAYAEGKIIESRTKPSTVKDTDIPNDWTEMKEIEFWNNIEYRVKPEQKKNKIMNISEILKYYPKGTKLYSPIWGEVEFIEVASSNNIVIKSPDGNKVLFYCSGAYHRNGECVLFPSKDQRDWKELKIGDIMIEKNSKYRPFKNAEECWQEMQKHQPFGWVKLKDTESGYYMLKSIASQVVIGFNETSFSYKKVFNDYTFADDTPFGVKEEE